MSNNTVANKKRIALIDADGILYAAALAGQTTCDGSPLQMLPLEYVYKDALDRIEEQVGWADAEDAFIMLSDRRNFRTSILPSYKGQRKASDRPILLDGLRNKMVEEAPYRVMLIEGLEADDACGIAAGQLTQAGRETVIVSPDKDLGCIPDTFLCVPYQGKHPTHYTTREMADDFHIYQTLVGDTCDNYKGLPGWGARKAGDLIDTMNYAGFTLAEKWEVVVEKYLESGHTKEDCLIQARVSRILRREDWDAVAKEPILFNFPLTQDKGCTTTNEPEQKAA